MVSLPALEALLHQLFIVDPAATLRDEDRKKARELVVVLDELARIAPRTGTLVDAAAGKGTVGLAALATVLPGYTLVAIERDAHRIGILREAAARFGIEAQARHSDLHEPSAWPIEPAVVVALHACGAASDAVIERAMAASARHVLLIPCCYGGFAVHADAALAPTGATRGWAEDMGFPAHGLVRAGLARAIVDAERTLRLEAGGYQTEVVDAIPASVTPFGRLWRARRVHEPKRMARAQEGLERLRDGRRA